MVVEANPVGDHAASVLQGLEPGRCTHWSLSMSIGVDDQSALLVPGARGIAHGSAAALP